MSTIAIDNLRRCKKCQTLYDDNVSDKDFCPADGHRHERGGFNYQLTFGIAESDAQSNWRRCRKCQAIFYNGLGQGRCASDPHAQEPHNADVTRDFRVPHGRPETEHIQAGWEFCTKCNVLFYDRSDPSHCTAGGEHESSPEASRYTLTHGRPPPVLIDKGPGLHPID